MTFYRFGAPRQYHKFYSVKNWTSSSMSEHEFLSQLINILPHLMSRGLTRFLLPAPIFQKKVPYDPPYYICTLYRCRIHKQLHISKHKQHLTASTKYCKNLHNLSLQLYKQYNNQAYSYTAFFVIPAPQQYIFFHFRIEELRHCI